MAWRVDIRTLRVLATGLERLADLSKGDAERVSGAASDAGALEAEVEGTASRTRQEILETGGEVRRLFRVCLRVGALLSRNGDALRRSPLRDPPFGWLRSRVRASIAQLNLYGPHQL